MVSPRTVNSGHFGKCRDPILAKVGVEGSNPFARSNSPNQFSDLFRRAPWITRLVTTWSPRRVKSTVWRPSALHGVHYSRTLSDEHIYSNMQEYRLSLSPLYDQCYTIGRNFSDVLP